MELGLLLLRWVLGLTMAAHGAQKLFGWFGGYGLNGTSGWLESLGFRPGPIHARLTGTAEVGGGLLLALGLLTPLGAAAVTGVMIVAVATIHLPNGFFNGDGGYEFNLLIGTSAIALAFMGPGRFSLDQALGWNLDGPLWGLTALAIAILAGGLVLSLRDRASIDEEVEGQTQDQAA